MCGIAGFCGTTSNNAEQIKKMCNKIHHRGPNAYGYWSSDDDLVTLGHKRLSILDLSENGTQPMISASQRFVISYNGEIYNYQTLSARLKRDGYVSTFRSSSDTEVILEYFEAYGIESVADMTGMFAIALYDRQEKLLYLLRDRMGEKPLYYGMIGGKFAFASELSALKELEGFDNPVSKIALNAFLRYKSVPQPLSIYEHIYKLIPGQILVASLPFGHANFKTYWSVKQAALNGLNAPFKGSEYEARKELERLLKNAISGQMISDVPIGSYLSGGIDSPLVTSIMQSLSPKSIKTYTIGFYDRNCNEAEYALEIARHLGTTHTEFYISEQDLLNVIPSLPAMFNEPLADPACLPTYLLSKMARKEVTVTLSGDGGDELFCGYDLYNRASSIWDKISSIPSPLRTTAGKLLQSPPFMYSNKLYNIGEYATLQNSHYLQELFRSEHNYYANHLVCGIEDPRDYLLGDFIDSDSHLLPDMVAYKQDLFLNECDIRSSMLYRDQTCFMTDTVLNKVDRAGMAVSLENRIPLLDKDIVEFSWSLPIAFKSAHGINKKILKDLLYEYVPKSLLDRPKHGFEVPLASWLASEALYGWADELIHNSQLVADGYLNQKIVIDLWKNFKKSQRHTLQTWYILQAESWYRYQK